MKFQKQFVQSVRLYFKEKGEAWLQDLPGIIHYCEQKWSMKMEKPYRLSINYVAPAKLRNGKEIVVKICIPGSDFLNELESLRLFKHQGIVNVLDYETEKGIIILEKLSPGYTLAEIEDDETACYLAAQVVRRLSFPAPRNTRIQTTRAREEELRDTVNRNEKGYGPLSQHVLVNALSIFAKLNQTIAQYKLLHGDFHHYNVLASEQGDWVVIDPKGLIGEVEYDLIQFLLNRLPDKGVYEVTKKRIEILTNELNLNLERFFLWGYCHAVLATAWTVEGMSYNSCFYRMISIFERLYFEYCGIEIGCYVD